MTSESWNRINDLWSRIWIAVFLWPADYPVTAPIALASVAVYFWFKRRKHPHPERIAIVSWFVLMLLWWVFRFNLMLYPFKLDGTGVRR